MSRIILETGLCRRKVLEHAFPESKERAHAVNTFWSVYVLDGQLSYALGLPMMLQDAYIDSQFWEPV